MSLHEITTRLLAVEDDQWDDVTGYVLIWEQQNMWGKLRSYVWGPGPRGNPRNSRGGWTTMRHAHVFPSYKAALAEVPTIKGQTANDVSDDSKFRIVRILMKQPVMILEDHAVDLLQKLAEL